MFIKKFDSLIPREFTYPIHVGGEVVNEVIKLGIYRLAFDKALGKEFKDAMNQATEDPRPIAQFLAGRTQEECREGESPLKPILGSWNLYVDEAETQLMPITWMNVAERPLDFVMMLAEEAIDAITPNPTKAGPSASTSDQKDS